MTSELNSYDLFFEFIETFMPSGFEEIDERDPLMLQLEEMMENNDQFFYIADLMQLKILYTSKRTNKMIGVPPEELDFSYFMESTHPDDIHRLNIARARVVKKAQEVFIAEEGMAFLSTNMRILDAYGKYSNFLLQNYLFYSTIPRKTVFYVKVHTNVKWNKFNKRSFHYYFGSDLSLFRYPNKAILKIGTVFSHREFEIIMMVESGISTEEIARKLFLSIYTVETHRRNILLKSKCPNFHSLILDLKERGLL